jgi:heme/copper-type cytochrome/quinol oxidase subunit 2
MGLPGVLLVPIGIAYSWFWIATLMEPAGGDPIRPWDLIATTIWSIFAIPTSLAVFLVARFVRAKRQKAT